LDGIEPGRSARWQYAEQQTAADCDGHGCAHGPDRRGEVDGRKNGTHQGGTGITDNQS
jgi:hypothetical protein